ncbi:C2 domain [Musa troglodytarum]|uniref:C2 domain n=1 Tax=Musa troglodytarum TaxID=320322 RepID=A0A9E7EZ66_9LILI|nr:C2 domain [Musa troglodytarum]
MAYRTLEITLVSAKGLKDVNLFFKMAVYAMVSLSDNRRARQRTPPDREGGRNPSWNSTLHLTILPTATSPATFSTSSSAPSASSEIATWARSASRFRISSLGPATAQPPVTSGKPKGILNFSYMLSERVAVSASEASTYQPSTTAYPTAAATVAYPPPPLPPPTSNADEPVMAYPARTSSAAYAAHGVAAPPYEYGYPPVAGHGYGYGAALPPAVQPRRDNKMGMGMGAGFVGGALGGLMVGDMMSNAAAAYDAGYDDGFDPAGRLSHDSLV